MYVYEATIELKDGRELNLGCYRVHGRAWEKIERYCNDYPSTVAKGVVTELNIDTAVYLKRLMKLTHVRDGEPGTPHKWGT